MCINIKLYTSFGVRNAAEAAKENYTKELYYCDNGL